MSPATNSKLGAPKRSKKASKKSKKSWRKNIDLDEIEDFLEDQRLEERLGGAFSARGDEELFTVDKGEGAGGEDEEEPPHSARLARRKELSERPLKCFRHLELTGGAADPKRGRNRRKLPEERANPVVRAMSERLRNKGVVKAKDKTAKVHRQAAAKIREASAQENSTRRRTKFDFDLWAEPTTGEKAGEEVTTNEWLKEKTKTHNLKNTGRLKRTLPGDFHEKTSDLEAVETPHSGASYNPSYKDHQNLLRKAWMAEVNKVKAQHKVDYHTTRMFPKQHEAPTQETWVKEMSEGLAPEEKETIESGDEPEEVDVKETNKVKTRKQRRKERERQVEEMRRLGARRAKQESREVFRIKSLRREIESTESKFAERKARRVAAKEAQRKMPARLGGHAYAETDVDIKLSDELTGNLRGLRPEGNLLEDRYKSLQKRNLVETRVKTKIVRNKHKRKKLEKRSYKMPWEKTV